MNAVGVSRKCSDYSVCDVDSCPKAQTLTSDSFLQMFFALFLVVLRCKFLRFNNAQGCRLMNKNNNTARLCSRFLLNFGKVVALLFVMQHCCFGQQLPNIEDIGKQIETASDFQDSSLGASVNSMLSRQPKGANSSTVELIDGGGEQLRSVSDAGLTLWF